MTMSNSNLSQARIEQNGIVILASGNGSNAQAIIDACAAGKIEGQISKIITNSPSAYVLERAKLANIETACIDHTLYADRESFDEALANEIDKVQPKVIVLAGFMRILSEGFVLRYLGKLLNIHPSLLPKYPGLNTHQRAIDANDSEHGTSVHFVTPELDGGPVILQAKVPIFSDDNAQELASRIQSQEYEIYPIVINWLSIGRIRLENGYAYLDNQKLTECGYASE
jgi:phosphoribosylglycinamide formyltransferase-1